MAQDSTARLEEKLAHLEKTVDELSEVVAAQARQIDRMEIQLHRLRDRDAAREAEGTGGIILGDERPPHY
jgi:SlyX protein